jgi:hypothetical protein
LNEFNAQSPTAESRVTGDAMPMLSIITSISDAEVSQYKLEFEAANFETSSSTL